MSGKKKTRKLLIVGIDGVRMDCLLKSNSPALLSLPKKSLYSFWGQTGPITTSGPSWTSVLSGSWHHRHRITDNDFSVASSNIDNCPSFLHTLKDALGKDFETAACFRWEGIGSILERSGIDHYCKFDTDKEALAETKKLFGKKNCPDASFLYLEDPDEAGHHYGFDYNCKEYEHAIETADAAVQDMLDIIKKRETEFNEHWCVIITTDHGGAKRERLTGEIGKVFEKFEAETNTPHADHYVGVHGLDIPQMRTVFIFYWETGMVQGTELIPGPKSVDVAASALAFFGITDAKSDGVAIQGQV
eukprot:Nk52_evm64s270 gene=Nk52_evmTU64s270